MEGTAPIGAVLARQLAALIRRSAIAQGPEHAASWIESWPPAGFRPTVHGIGTLFPALGELVDRHDLAL